MKPNKVRHVAQHNGFRGRLAAEERRMHGVRDVADVCAFYRQPEFVKHGGAGCGTRWLRTGRQ
jgi:hypothetical protein